MKKTVLVIAKEKLSGIYEDIASDGIEVERRAFDGAIDAADEIRADIVLIDSDYDTAKGFELLTKIKSSHPGIPIIFITSYSSEDTVIKAFRAGARGYFKTPLNMYEVKTTIEALLRLKEHSTEDRCPFYFGGPDVANLVPASTPPSMLRALRLIMDNLSSKLTLEEIAREAVMSKYHFCRSFQKYFGMSPMRFVTCMRIKRALELLKRNNLTVSTIAGEVGYSDAGNFIRHFKRLTGQTPTAYKVQHGLPHRRQVSSAPH